MSRTYISVELRRIVETRAHNICEYCRIHEDDTMMGCHVDHIISEKHDGKTEADNLAYSCASCNRSKGSNVGSFVPPVEAGTFCRFFHPRTDTWAEHFSIDATDGITILAATDVGRVTSRIFGFNRPERLLERANLFAVHRYPAP